MTKPITILNIADVMLIVAAITSLLNDCVNSVSDCLIICSGGIRQALKKRDHDFVSAVFCDKVIDKALKFIGVQADLRADFRNARCELGDYEGQK